MALDDSAPSREHEVLSYSPRIDQFWEDLIKQIDRLFYFDEGPRAAPRLTAKTWQKMKDQATVEAFSGCGLGNDWWGLISIIFR
ncbi:MAG: hypothetical protein MUO26_09935 [Methanotrichaceae archaeon]|nr:hypothetical protein [Methanotrichaceae archaeon]